VSARGGHGSVLLLDGPPGIGKTSLLGLARRRGSESGMRVLRGRGTELEREYPLGVVRQCVGPAVRREGDAARLLQGAARLAGPALLDVTEDMGTPPLGLMHGLYWLVANLADESPLLMLVDDAQWADEPSLRFLSYLASRVDELALAIVITVRDSEGAGTGSSAVLDELRLDRLVLTLRPRPLTPLGVSEVLRARARLTSTMCSLALATTLRVATPFCSGSSSASFVRKACRSPLPRSTGSRR
jgi:hypothetical protein